MYSRCKKIMTVRNFFLNLGVKSKRIAVNFDNLFLSMLPTLKDILLRKYEPLQRFT